MKKVYSLALALGLFFPAALSTAAGLSIASKAIVLKNNNVDVTIRYPQTGNRTIDTVLLGYARHAVDTFEDAAVDKRPNENPYTLDTKYAVERNDAQIFAVVFTEFSYLGGAHPNSNYATFDFMLPDGAQVFLPEIVDGTRGIARVSQLSIASLRRSMNTDPDPLGTGPLADNFKNFAWLPQSLHLYFPPYQVASYATGPQEAYIPLSALRDVIRPDWRAPAPSFDCRKATTTIEHAICADAALARLDRKVAEAFQARLGGIFEPAEKVTLRQTQRTLLARRDTSCVAGMSTQCLTKLYRDRLVALSGR